ncbi:MAG: hypothetical protein A3I61_16140 [Acidobacteria bacterium RIFCSPLOWO2_02_FULL_68_18]|nr:MAG: hypothetical protein A3I61_16140 [Acidobacteria bacterium RIFCSPLOWO2_02_FULL_68_18]OFW48962.1 MAG: hypothetical protein A3G77_05220 [Acidobacteria bacterium RIFCSPLOWO2_12_FULL_68_19]
MKQLVIAAAMIICLVSLAAVASADTLILRNGTRVNGRVVSIAERTITFEDGSGVSRRYNADRVDALEFTLPSQRDAAARTGSSSPRFEVLPAGTELTVRTAEEIDSSTAVVDQTFSAVVERDILGESESVVIPAGSHAVLVVREISSGGVTGSPDIVLDLQSMTVGGRRYLVSTTDLKQDTGTGIGANKRTAQTIGGGAAIGTIIGAIAGGKKGAVIGVLVGAAGGAGVQVLNRGKDVRVPAETLLTFKLSTPASLLAER